MSSRQPDPSKIRAPGDTPQEKPDQKTTDENKEFQRKKASSPTDRIVEQHEFHIATFREHIHYHQEECSRFRQDISQARTDLNGERARGENLLAEERKKSERLAFECVKLRELSWAVGYMMLLGNVMVAFGSIALGIAGCWPELTNERKYAIGGGAATAICGVLLTVLAVAAGRRARKNADPLEET